MDILNESHKLMNDRIKPSLISLFYMEAGQVDMARAKIGSGSLVWYKDNLFVFTCNHVADEFMKSGYTALVLQVDSSIKIDKSHVVSWNGVDDPYDIAYLKLSDKANISRLLCLTRSDFVFLEDAKWDGYASLIYGYPGELVKQLTNPYDISLQGFSMMGYCKGLYRDGVKLRFDYPDTNEVVINAATQMPQPYGLSGSCVWRFEVTPSRVSDYTQCKVVAIENSWSKRSREYLATPAKHVFDLIDRNESL